MTENTALALKTYKKVLQDSKLVEMHEYKVNCEIKTYTDTFKAISVKPFIHIDQFEIAPMLVLEFIDESGNSVFLNFADSNCVIDHYDKEAILKSLENLSAYEEYDISLFNEALDKINIVL